MYDVIIIGSGPAGYTAAIYTSRALLKTLIISGPQPGGQLTTTTDVENFPGFPEGIIGPELLDKMRKQAERFGSGMVTDVVNSVISTPIQSGEKSLPRRQAGQRDPSSVSQRTRDDKQRGNTFLIRGQDKTYEARTVIIATGASAKTLGIPSEEKFRGKGVSYCATCDGFFFKGKHVAVLGGGDTAMEEAIFLTRFADKVTIIHRREEFRASPIMVEEAKKDSKIRFLLNKEVVEFYGDGVLRGVRLRDKTNGTNMTNTTEDVELDGVFVAIGHVPATEFLKGFVEMDEKGYIRFQNSESRIQNSNNASTATSIPGIFAAGDCMDSRYRQAIVAAGMGCMAGMDVEKYLS